ncbi:RNA polymerase sigma factor [Streptococcus porcinus]|uniref:RNA polymerase sigma factor protein n=2 Tax=Streptococcus porcinus TaxID=1340 RepID=A0A4V0H0E8_STRPO|nr:RNA polymerase sigma factor [Streptococcus porcinus]EGJ26735.1 Sigma-70 region 2 [Streptococcus porcinus str. Jelinkova 176]SQG42541.1 RNA polymerase sigma factor protein [Streptococcus porcinus]VTT41585.1 RNA polymerase sigma factor protein [Streptococcus porcinus]VTT42579.1 RNA polymerase sigma factor protein [Streptococcus porcinus]
MDYAQEIITYLVNSGISPHRAQDVTQDVFLQMLECNYSIPLEKIRAWMYRTAIRRYIDLYRRDKRYYDLLQRDFFSQQAVTLYDLENYDDLYEAISQLSQKSRLLLDLYYFQGFSVKEIATITGYSQSNIKIRLMRTRHLLRKQLQMKGYSNDHLKNK